MKFSIHSELIEQLDRITKEITSEDSSKLLDNGQDEHVRFNDCLITLDLSSFDLEEFEKNKTPEEIIEIKNKIQCINQYAIEGGINGFKAGMLFVLKAIEQDINGKDRHHLRELNEAIKKERVKSCP